MYSSRWWDKQRDVAVRKHATFFFLLVCDREEARKASGDDRSASNAAAGTRAENSVRWMLTTTTLPFDNSNENARLDVHSFTGSHSVPSLNDQ